VSRDERVERDECTDLNLFGRAQRY